MASKEKVKKKSTKLAEQAGTKDDERPGSAHSQISVKEAKSEYQSDNTEGEKFRQDEIKQEQDKNKQEEKKDRSEPSTAFDKSKEKMTAKKKENKGEKKEIPVTPNKETPGTPKKYKQKKTESEKPKPKPEKRTPSPALSPSEVQRTPSPYRKNKVEPTLAKEGHSNMGSSASLKSASTIREAWTDHSDMGSLAVFQAITSTDSSVINLQEAAASKQVKNDKRDTVSLMSRDNKEDEVAKNAYIPYLYARKCIAKVMDDLTNMKANHIRIVGDIQTQYKEIEDETQAQFNIFVFCLRNQYSEKVKTFKQVIDVHRSELQSKEEYWNEMLASLAERNNRLLKSKKMLLVQNKVEIERLEKEMEELRRNLTHQVDKANVALLSVEKGRGLEAELKAVQDELETEKSEVKRLQAELAASAVVTTTVVPTMHKDEKKAVVTETAMPVMAALPVSDREKDKMSQERGEIDEERQKMVDERKLMVEDRLKFDEERNKWLVEVAALQASLAVQTKESAEWKAKYSGMKSQLEDSATLHAKYKALENQYAALAAIVEASATSKELAQENAKKTEADKEMMSEERQKVEQNIAKWEADFLQQSGRVPTEDDKSDSVKEMYVQKEELDTMVVSLEQKLSTFEKVEKGKVPDPPEVVPVPVTVKDPEVQTVEVKVPDPVLVEQLKEAYDDIAQLRLQIAELQAKNTRQGTQITQKNEELSRQRDRIAELEREVAALKTAAVGVAVAGVNSEELEALKKENRELKKDMKKLSKKLEKLEQNPDPTADPEDRLKVLDGKVTTLEEKVTDLECDNEALLEDNEKLANDKQKLLDQIAGLQQSLVTAETDVSVSAGAPVVAAVPVPVTATDDKQECSVPGHTDLVEQLAIKTQELIEKDAKLQEQEQRIAEKIQEIEKLREESKGMRKDMLKMAKQHAKLQQQLKQLENFEKTKKLLEAVALYVHKIHGDVPEAANQVVMKLTAEAEVANNAKAPYDNNKKAVEAWEQKFKTKNGRASSAKDRDQEGIKLYAALEESKAAWEEKKIHVEALNIMRTGDYQPPTRRESVSLEAIEEDSAVEQIEHQMSELDNKVTDLESENDSLKKERSETQAKMRELEAKLEEARKQAELQASLAMGMQSDELSEQITKLQSQVSGLDAALLQEKTAHSNTKDELDNLRKQMEIAKEEMTNERAELKAKMDSKNKSAKTVLKALEEEIEKVKGRNEELEKERLSNLPVDAANEIKNLQIKISALEKEKSSSGQATANLQAQITELHAKLDSSNKNLENQRAANRDLEAKLKNGKSEKDKAVREAVTQVEKREQQRANEDKKRIAALEKRIKQLEAAGAKSDTAVVIPAGGKGGDAAAKALRDQMVNVKRENNDLNARIRQLETELKRGGGVAAVGASVEEKNQQKRNEKILKELEKKYEIEKKKTEKLDDNLKTAEEELKVTKKDLNEKENELKKTKAELATLGVAAKEGVEAATKVKSLETENKKLTDENKTLAENYNSERVLRRKYYNMVEDMKGKIRVYCRARPLSVSEQNRGSVSVLKSPDEYCIQVESQRGTKEFQFDQVFMEDSTQEKIFEDTNVKILCSTINLIQSAVDGYNVCIFAYGQTGSGKTFTMIGDRSGQFQGIAPRAFNRIFELAQELRSKFQITVTAYMMELYNDKLIDLFAKPGTSDDEKMEIKKDKKGMVFVQGSMLKEAHNSKELFALFEEGSKNRHTASTKMNAESSRSHLVIGVMMESVNKSTGQVIKGKLSLVDLAGSERVGKTGATAEQLKEAMSINKSLSALGDVISALSSDQQFIPYRNNKLTMLMQDSLGGNAKTLMFVNISPADYNQDETVISLMYASRVKLITNDASKNADNKEIARLKAIIAKLKKGEAVEEDADE